MAVDFAPDEVENDVIDDVPEGKSLEASLESAFEALTKGESEPPANGQPRDQVGRFAPKSAEAAAPVETAPAQTPQPAPATAPTDDMPRSWGAAKAQVWAAAPPEVRAAIIERENQMAAGVQRFSGLAEYADIAESNGKTLKQAMDSYVQFEQMLERDFFGAVGYLAQQYGVDPKKLGAVLAGQEAAPARAPDPAMFRDPRVDEVLQHFEAEKRGRIESEVDAFWKNPANKYAEDVGLEMAEEIRKAKALGKSITLQQAYDRAIWTNAEVRGKLLTERAQAEAAAKTATAQRVATTSRAAAKSLVPTPAATPGKVKGMSLDQALAASWDQLAS
jgi:hypothetical protein